MQALINSYRVSSQLTVSAPAKADQHGQESKLTKLFLTCLLGALASWAA